MSESVPFFDAQLHADGLSDQDLQSMALFGVRAALVPARDAVCTSVKELVAHFEELILKQSARLGPLGIKAYTALGVHPARIPWHGLEEVLAAIPRLAVHGRLVALGAIGLDQGGAREEQVFERQLELAHEVNLPVLVHTPERDKDRITRRTLAILRGSGLLEESVLVSHANARTLRTIRGFGFYAGLTVNPARLTAEEAVRLVRHFGGEGVVLSSGAGDGVQDILALARTASMLESEGMKPALIRRVMGENAAEFLRLDRAVLAGEAAGPRH